MLNFGDRALHKVRNSQYKSLLWAREFDQNSWFLTVFCPYLFKKSHVKKKPKYMIHRGAYRIKQIWNIFLTTLPWGNHIPTPRYFGGFDQNSHFFTVFCPYLFKKTHIVKNLCCMKYWRVYRIKQFYNIFWTNLLNTTYMRIWPKSPIFHSILPISLQKIAHVKKIELFEILGGMPDQIKKKKKFNER